MTYTLEDLIRELGLPRDTLRIWLRGYRVLGPRRELYTAHHLEKLRLLDRALKAGHPLDLVGRMTRRELRKLLEGRRPEDYFLLLLEAVQGLDAKHLALSLRQAGLRLPLLVFLEQVVGPLLEAVGRFWERGTLSVANEHMISVVVRSELSRLYEANATDEEAPVMLVTTPAGHRHELGALMAALAAADAGWRPLFLGCDLPTKDILQMALSLSARALALSIVYPLEDRLALAQVAELRERLPSTVEIFAGGRASRELKPRLDAMGVQTMDSLSDFARQLKEEA